MREKGSETDAVVVRAMSEKDIPAVESVDREFVNVSTVEHQGIGPGAREWLEETLGDEEWEFFVAETDGRVVGFGAALDLGAECGDFCFDGVEETLWLVYTAVLEEWTNRGIGGKLLSHAELKARERGRRYVFVDVASDNPNLRWYEKRGFREIGGQKYLLKSLE